MNFTSANWKFILKLYIYLHEVKCDKRSYK